MKTRTCIRYPLFALALMVGAVRTDAAARGTNGSVFTCQGLLTDGGRPANGLYDMRFALYDVPANRLPIGKVVSISNAAVINGLFTADV